MKNLLIGFGAIIILTIVSTDAISQGRQGKGQGRGQGRATAGGGMQQRGGGHGANTQRGRSTGTPLDSAASQEFQRMWEEEKLARDVYTALAKSSNQPIFNNIAAAESRHMQSVGRLLQSGIGRANFNDTAGVFSDPEYQKLYQSLVASGSQSPLEALYVGAKIEEMDIADLRQLLSKTTDQRTRQVLEHLLRGSENHLRAFASQIANNGGSYEAQFLSQAEFDQIANSPGQGQGRQAGGQGQGNRGQFGSGQGQGNRGQFGSGQGRRFSSQSRGSGGQNRQGKNRGGRGGGNGRRGG